MSWLPPFSRGGAVRAASARDAVEVRALERPEDRAVRQRRQRQRRHAVGVGRDQVGLALGPLRQQLGRRRGAHQARVVDAHVGALRDVARGRDVAREVPDHLVGVGEAIGQEAAAVRLGEDARVAPAHAGVRALVLLVAGVDLEDVDDQQVAGLGALDVERPAEDVHAGQRRVADVVGGVVVLDRAVEPLAAVRAEHVARLDAHGRRDVRMPAVVTDVLLVGELLGVVQREEVLRHVRLLRSRMLVRTSRSDPTLAVARSVGSGVLWRTDSPRLRSSAESPWEDEASGGRSCRGTTRFGDAPLRPGHREADDERGADRDDRADHAANVEVMRRWGS